MDDLHEIVKVNDEGGAVSNGGEEVDEHEHLVEVVSASEELGERHSGWRRLDLLGLLDLILLLELLHRCVRIVCFGVYGGSGMLDALTIERSILDIGFFFSLYSP